MSNIDKMSEMQSTSSFSSKKSKFSSSISKFLNNSSSTISMSENQRSQSLQSLQLSCEKSWVVELTRIPESALSLQNLKQLERSRNELKNYSRGRSKTRNRERSSNSITSISSNQSASSAERYSPPSTRRSRGRRSKVLTKNKNYREALRRNVRTSTRQDTLCSLSTTQQRPSIIEKFKSRRSNNNDTFSLDRPSSHIDICDDGDYVDYYGEQPVDIEPPKKLPLENTKGLWHRDDNKSHASSILYARETTPAASPFRFEFANSNTVTNDVIVQSTSDRKTSIDEDSAGTEQKIPPLKLKIPKGELAKYELKKHHRKSKKAKRRRSEKERSGSALSLNKNEDREKSPEFTNENGNHNEAETISTNPILRQCLTADSTQNRTEVLETNIESQIKPAVDTTTIKKNSANDVIIIYDSVKNNLSKHLKPIIRIYTRTQATILGLIERNQKIINERRGVPPAKPKEQKVKGITKPKRSNVRNVKGKRPPGRPRKTAPAPAVINIVDETPYVEYEDGRKLPSLPYINTPSTNRSRVADNDENDTDWSTSSKKNYYPTAFEKFTKEIGIEEKAGNDNCDAGIVGNVAGIKYCLDDIDDNGKNEKKLNSIIVSCETPVENKPSTALVKPPEIPEDINHSTFGETKPNLRKRIPRLAKKPLTIVEDEILPKGTIMVEPLSTSVAIKEQDVVKKATVTVDRKRKNIFGPEVAKKRKLLHASEFNPANESELNSFGIRSTVPSRRSLLPAKKIIFSDEFYERLNTAFKKWAEIPEISELLNPTSPNEETVKPKPSIKDRLGSIVRTSDKEDSEDMDNCDETSMKVPRIVDTIKEASMSSENISCQIKTTPSIPSISQEVNRNASTSKVKLNVQLPLDRSQNNIQECISTGNSSMSARLAPKRSLDNVNLAKLHDDSKRSCRNRWKREYHDDSDSSSSSESKVAASVSKFEKESIISESSSIKSDKSIIHRLAEWSKTGAETIIPAEVESDDNSNCHSPSSVKTVVNASERGMRDCISPLRDDKIINLNEQLDYNVDTSNSSYNDDGDNDNDGNLSSSSSSSSVSSSSKSATNASITMSGLIESAQNQQLDESINKDLDADQEGIIDLSYESDDISNGDGVDCNIIIGTDNVGDDEESIDDDDDAISLCAPTIDDLALDDIDLQNFHEEESFYSTSSLIPYRRMRSANIGRFVSENVREFDALYNNQNNIDDTNVNIFDAVPQRAEPCLEQIPTRNLHNNTVFNQHSQIDFREPIASSSRIPTRINDSKNTFNDVKFKFIGYCFSTLKRNSCTNTKCKFEHKITSKLTFLHMENSKEIKSTLTYAITERFFHYLKTVYNNSIRKLDAMEIIDVYSKIVAQSFPNIVREFIKSTLDAFLSRCRNVQQFVDGMSSIVQQSTTIADDNIPLILIDSLSELIEDGKSWETLRNLILKLAFPTQQIIARVLNECTEHPKSSQHILDIDINIIQRLDENILMNIDPTIIEKFNKLVDDLKNAGSSGNSRTQSINSKIVEGERDIMNSSSIASPDPTTLYNYNNTFDHMNNNYLDVDNNISNTRDGTKKAGINLVQGISMDLRNRLGVRKTDATSGWKLIEVDNISRPSSVYKNSIWLFHKDFDLLKESLERKDYDAVSRTLEIAKRSFTLERNKFEHPRNFYRILCKTILETPEHLEKIILITVQNGMATAPDFLQMLLSVGINILKKLIHIEAWIVAYRVLKVLKHYYGGTNNVCNYYKNIMTASFVLLTVEIYVANRHPLKAFDLIKQNNLLTHDRSKWRVTSEDVDEQLRLLNLSLLLKSLCIEHVEYAFIMYMAILKDQNDNFIPLDLSKHTNRIILELMRGDRHDDLLEMIDSLLKYHSVASPLVIRAAVVNVFHLNQVLSRQLHKYAMELLIYRQIQHPVNSLMFILPVDVNWTEEEIYFMVQEYLEKLHSAIGKNLHKIKTRQLMLYLNFEIYPSLSQLYDDDFINDSINNVDFIINAKKAMKNVLERFDPVIRFLTRTQDQRLCKFVNSTVVNYLKAHWDE